MKILKPNTNVLYLISLLLLGTILSACKKPVPIDLTKKDSIALVSFTLDKTLVPKGSTETDNGPGLLQKAVKGKEASEEKHFKYHYQCLDSLYDQYVREIQTTMLNIPFLDFDKVASNDQYQNLTRHVPRMVMGSDVAPGSSYLTPNGINYVSAYDNKKLDSIATLLGTNNLLLVSHKIEYDAATAFIEVGLSKLYLKTDLTIYEKGVGIVSSKSFNVASDDELNLIAGLPNRKKFAPLISQTNLKMLKEIKGYYLRQKEKSEALVAEQS